ncbi:MAG: radical SAM protein [Syntrophobacteraceae bacterium]|nr:radical SAM protein [Syntrophobacteraceae bacterium]
MKSIFGPVPSRRFGKSLGIDVIPAKTCSFDCIYCESGPTTSFSLTPQNFIACAKVLEELRAFIRKNPDGADVFTFSSAGEPTLYGPLGELITAVKKDYPQTPLIVLTNGSLLWKPEVRRGLLGADRVVPSLDAVTPKVFRKINRPHPGLEPGLIIEGLRAFRKEYKGQLHIEVLLVEGVNDSPEELSAIASTLETLRPDKVELNSVVRPPAHAGTHGLTGDGMNRAAAFFSALNLEIIGAFQSSEKTCGREDLAQRIVDTVQRRPCTANELAASLGVSFELVQRESKKLEEQGKLSRQTFGAKSFLCPPAPIR